ncbi:MbnP family protein [Colwellia sp. PAMC 21821]|uniref:MbnP family protein n=1 Tax=Colwellia sp. PAMC 21821 TaxID=1816219 RepID=UPI0009C11EEB|nr:MbnP family protein [Colwellia sp. PAMC 21821]ARD42970.1 hypothetical protein A3Q33_00665 [Colwellia sp. PAMC 21821]
MTKSNKLTLVFCTLILAATLVVAIAWHRTLPQDLTLRFHPYVGDKPLVLNNQSYKNPGGDGEFTIRDFQLFISNITLAFPNNTINEEESYHLVRFDGDSTFDQIVIPSIKIQNLRKLSLGIGIDPKANGAILFSGDLDPNSRMAWNWQVGYKFLLVEGTLALRESQLPLVYHIGFDDSYTELNFDITPEINVKNGVINFNIDLRRLFQKSSKKAKSLKKQESKQDIEYIDMSEMSHVKFSPRDVKAIAIGFQDFISML